MTQFKIEFYYHLPLVKKYSQKSGGGKKPSKIFVKTKLLNYFCMNSSNIRMKLINFIDFVSLFIQEL